MMTRMIPKVFYADMEDGLGFFVGCLGFNVILRDHGLAVVGRDGVRAYLVQDAEFAAKDRPELTVETDDIQGLFDEISALRPDMLHPKAREVKKRPWGALEFAVRDATGVCVIVRQW